MSAFSRNNVGQSEKNQRKGIRHAGTAPTRIALAITAGEAVLWGGLVYLLSDYWLMLPVALRSTAAVVLAVIGGIRENTLNRCCGQLV